MEMTDGCEIKLTVADLRALVVERCETLRPGYRVIDVRFEVEGYDEPGDWQVAWPRSHRLAQVQVTMEKLHGPA